MIVKTRATTTPCGKPFLSPQIKQMGADGKHEMKNLR
jgi:hypothetical protein